jgi:CheY-like chemotaxis protein
VEHGDYVLIVDDDDDIRETLELILASRGYRCMAARDGAEALAVMREHPLPAVVLLDIMMPGMNGRQFRAAQLEDPRLASVPLVVMTGDCRVDQGGGALGAFRSLKKPIDIGDLIAAVRDAR